MHNEQPTPVSIQTGISDSRNTVVLGGLEPGDQVITGQRGAGQTASSQGQGSGSILPFGGPRPGGNQNQNQRPQGAQGGGNQAGGQATGAAGGAGNGPVIVTGRGG